MAPRPDRTPRRLAKKLVGTTLLVVLVPLYAMTVSTLAAAHLPEASTAVQVVFFAFFGLIWIVPAGAIIKWMATPPAR